MTLPRPNRVLVTGVSNPLGAEVARRLAPHVPHLYGRDLRDPISALEEMDFVHADTRHVAIGKLIRQLTVDTVVHLALMVDSPRACNCCTKTTRRRRSTALCSGGTQESSTSRRGVSCF